jgi:hypothetical protein
VVRSASVGLPDGGRELRVRAGRDAPWTPILRAAFGDDAHLLDLAAGGKIAL